MKKIAIITLMRNPNHGNVLQNIAMQRIFEKRGCVAETVINRKGSTLFLSGFKTKIKLLINCLLNRNNTRRSEKRRQRFLNCCRRNIRYSPISYDGTFSEKIIDKYDFFVAGSDQIWNPWFGLATEFELLAFAPEEKIMSYAGSFGVSEFENLSESKREEITSYLKRFKDVSCRESSGTAFIEETAGVTAYTHIDPTMLLKKEEWRRLQKKPDCEIPERYVFVYMLGEISDRYREIIERKAESLDAQVINILENHFVALDPLEFLWLIDHSLFVCADSFHACVFSILFHKTFAIFDRIDSQKKQNARFDTLLEKFEIPATSVFVTADSEPTGELDWESIDARLEAERVLSNDYIDSHIGASKAVKIVRKADCCGCNACQQICPQKCISMVEDSEGFRYPEVDESRCTSCGLCQKICPVINAPEKDDSIISAYACYSKDSDKRIRSSSGGMFHLLADYVLEQSGIVFGAGFDDGYNVRHMAVADNAELEKLFGSKYVQSDTADTFSQIKQLLNAGNTVLFSGTACQISGLKSFLRKPYEKLITVDVLCHGAPSPLLWSNYLEEMKEIYHSQPEYITFRAKTQGWKQFSMRIEFENGSVYDRTLTEDTFLRLFLNNICLRPSCHDCKFKTLSRDSDISLGDYWGIENTHRDMDDDAGASVVIIHSQKGAELFEAIADGSRYTADDIDRLLPKTMDSRKSVAPHHNRTEFFKKLADGESATSLVKLIEPSLMTRVKRKLKRVKNRILGR